MLKLIGSLVLLASAAEVIASPVAEPVAPSTTLEKRASCTFSGSNGAAAAMASQKACSTIVLSSVAVPAGTTLDLSDLADGTTVIFEGETTWGYKEWAGPLLQISGKNIKGGNGGKTKPKFFAAHGLTSSSSIINLHILNTPVQAVSINGCDGLTITDMTIDDSAGDTQGGHNTDAFDIGSSSNIIISGAKVYNQDDCVAVNSGTGITFTGGLCSGGHGLSIGSVGGRSDNTVENVSFTNSQVTKSDNGLRIKASKGKTGTIKGITYSGITLSSIRKYGILIEQNYDGGDLKGEPTSGIPITDLTMENISGKGAVASSGHNIAIVCGSGACSNWTWKSVEVTGGQTYGSCENVPSVAHC
ncbi:glycoside hydrolase family 28 protein [Aspergillus novofumigatus IBT 16806]|uniref:endo-polygalacturonase n=1 Tax=Aspergillus novofumigatus (strain IBT 16806) TaxID=1392255 RepID=A0A2I1C7I2_ASPN1|nr:putative extracellular polygalacturonase [Aspergillus novofumigatus IBT 16806]PKX93598.1 putative extracellular polygalacturonase [Aspergillus novofumigatus IBT 16806]